MHTIIKNIHLICALLFALYILLDRIYIRNFMLKNQRENFYSFIKYPMLILSVLLLFSGVFLLFYYPMSWLLMLKVLSAVLLLFGFFYCPKYMKKTACLKEQILYRFGVVILLVLTLILGYML